MNEMLFRAKLKDNSEWIYGYYVRAGEKHYIFTGETGRFPVDAAHPHLMYKELVRYEVDPESIGWYIGKEDCEGGRIFKGDFVKRVLVSGIGHMLLNTVYMVDYLDYDSRFGAFDEDCDMKFGFDYDGRTEWLVAGNIYDNKWEDFQ